MTFEGWWICDNCGKRVNRDDKDALKTWIGLDIESHFHWEKKDAKPLLDASVCGQACAIAAVQQWLDEQEESAA